MQSEKAQVQEGWRSSSRGSKTNPNLQLVNKSSLIGPHKVLQSSLINTGVFREGGLFKRGGGLIEDFRYCYYNFFGLSDVKKIKALTLFPLFAI